MRFGRQALAWWICSTHSTVLVAAGERAAFISVKSSFARRNISSNISSLSMAARVALCQFPVTENKDTNHKTASDYLQRAADGGAQLAVLPEIWNSPYATAAFAEYAEVLPNVGDTTTTSSPSAQLLMEHAKKSGMFIVGGSIPEKTSNGKIYNTCLVIDPQGTVVAKHRKVHLFDISVPGGITFRESDTLSPGESLTAFDGGSVFGMVGVGIWYVRSMHE